MVFEWGHSRRYNDFSTYFKKLYKNRVQKISIDAGFTCPNRDGSRGVGGCTYCNNVTFKPTYCSLETSIDKQLLMGVEFFSKKYEEMKYLAYFQSYTNTYAPLENLKELYSEALKHPKVIGLSIATRPDCLQPEVLDYLQELSEKYYVVIELGMESHLDKTLELINRGHSFAESVEALNELRKRNLRCCAHLMLGLPGENRDDFRDQARTISELPIDNLKLHQLQIQKGTIMGVQYKKYPEQFDLFTVEEYLDIVVEYLELLNPKIILERFVSQSPANMLIAPKWGLKNFEFIHKLDKQLAQKNTWQGRLYNS